MRETEEGDMGTYSSLRTSVFYFSIFNSFEDLFGLPDTNIYVIRRYKPGARALAFKLTLWCSAYYVIRELTLINIQWKKFSFTRRFIYSGLKQL